MLVQKFLAANPPQEIESWKALETWRNYRAIHAPLSVNMPLLTQPDGNAKMKKSGRHDLSLSLAPHTTSGHNVCINSTITCRATCVAFAGNGFYDRVINARSLRVKFLVDHRDAFCTLVKAEIQAAKLMHEHVACRLNAFSDIPWEQVAPWLLDIPGVIFYDYTKIWNRTPPANYHLCFSAGDLTTDQQIIDRCARGDNVAVIFDVKNRPNGHWQHELPTSYLGIEVTDGDHDDTRYDDPRGVIVGLRMKGHLLPKNKGKLVRSVA